MDACVVDRSSFEVVCEMNPQIGQQLRIMAESEPLLDTVVCLNPSRSLTAKQETDMNHVLQKLQESPQGKQILMIFGIHGFVPFEEKYIESTRNLLENHTSLRKKHENLALDRVH
jgi:phosphonate transport system substrate-binding protein